MGSVLLGLKAWVQGFTSVYYSGAIGLAFGLLVRSGKLAIVLSYVGVLFVAGLILMLPLLLMVVVGTGGMIWLAARGHTALGIGLNLAVTFLFFEVLLSLAVPTWTLRFFCRWIPKHLDAAG